MIVKSGPLIRAVVLTALFATVNFGGLVAVAQPFPQPAPGLWTIGPAAACPASSYFWTTTNDKNQFRDQAGNIDDEQIISRRPDGFITQTVQSAKVQAGTQWNYRFVSNDSVEVRNLGTGKSFVLNRCSIMANTSTVKDAGTTASSTLRPAGTYSYTEQGYQGKMTITEVPVCDVNAFSGCQSRSALKAKIATSNANGSQCDVDAVENIAARVSVGGTINTVLVADAIRIDVKFLSGKAIISNNNGGDFGAFCGIGTYFLGNWSKIRAQASTAHANSRLCSSPQAWQHVNPDAAAEARGVENLLKRNGCTRLTTEGALSNPGTTFLFDRKSWTAYAPTDGGRTLYIWSSARVSVD